MQRKEIFLSIGFLVKKSKICDKTRIRLIQEFSLLEVSLVRYPANPYSIIEEYKAFDKGGMFNQRIKSKSFVYDLQCNDQKSGMYDALPSRYHDVAWGQGP